MKNITLYFGDLGSGLCSVMVDDALKTNGTESNVAILDCENVFKDTAPLSFFNISFKRGGGELLKKLDEISKNDFDVIIVPYAFNVCKNDNEVNELSSWIKSSCDVSKKYLFGAYGYESIVRLKGVEGLYTHKTLWFDKHNHDLSGVLKSFSVDGDLLDKIFKPERFGMQIEYAFVCSNSNESHLGYSVVSGETLSYFLDDVGATTQ